MSSLHLGFRAGFLACLPLAFSVVIFGLVYGLLAAGKGLSVAETVLMSLIVFAGSSQLLALELWTHPPAVTVLALAVLILNLRYLLQTAALKDLLLPLGLPRALAASAFNADENWAVTIQALRGPQAALVTASYYMGSAMCLYSFWAVSGGIGWFAGGLVPDPQALGLGIVGTAVFVALLHGLYRSPADFLPWGAAAASAGIASLTLPGAWYILIGGLAGAMTGAVRDTRKRAQKAAA